MFLQLTVLFSLMAAGQSSGVESTRQVQADSVLIRLIDEVEVPSQAAGVLSAIDVTEGQSVKKGARLARVDDAEARLLWNRAKIELKISESKAKHDVPVRVAQKTLDFGRSDLDRLLRAAKELPRSVSQTQLDETRLRAEQAELELENARHEVDLTSLSHQLKENDLLVTERNVRIRYILSPLNGVVVEVARRPGEWVEPGETVLRIVRVDRLRAEGFVLAKELAGVVEGSPATVTVQLPGQREAKFSGKVVFVSPEVNAVNERVRVWADVNNEKGLIKPGLRALMTISPTRTGR